MANVNKVFLIGNLTRDPELRYTPSGAAVSDLGLAVNRIDTDKNGERREEVLFVDITVWGRTAENCCQYLKKGRPIHVEGFLRLDTWDDRNSGEKRSKMKVVAERVQFLDSGRGGTQGDSSSGPAARDVRRGEPSADAHGGGLGNGAAGSYPAAGGATARPPADDPEPAAEDDIPF